MSRAVSTALLSARYLTLIISMVAQGWVVGQGRVHYAARAGARGKISVLNLDGAVVHPDGRIYLWDYTWFGTHNRELTNGDMHHKRAQCALRFAELRQAATTGGFDEGFRYADCHGILITFIQYNGRVTLDVQAKPA